MRHDDYCTLLGDQMVATYLRNKMIYERDTSILSLTQRVGELEARIAEQEAIIQKFSTEPVPSLPKVSAPDNL